MHGQQTKISKRQLFPALLPAAGTEHPRFLRHEALRQNAEGLGAEHRTGDRGRRQRRQVYKRLLQLHRLLRKAHARQSGRAAPLRRMRPERLRHLPLSRRSGGFRGAHHPRRRHAARQHPRRPGAAQKAGPRKVPRHGARTGHQRRRIHNRAAQGQHPHAVTDQSLGRPARQRGQHVRAHQLRGEETRSLDHRAHGDHLLAEQDLLLRLLHRPQRRLPAGA